MEQYIFVDGGYLENIVVDLGNNYFEQDLSINYGSLRGKASKAFYYHALPEDSADEAFVQERYHRISETEAWHCNFGVVKGEGGRRRQKGVDVQLAIDAFEHRIRGNYGYLTLLTGDLDFFPLIEALVRQGTHVELMCDLKSTSAELMRCADTKTFLSPDVASRFVFGSKSLREVPGWRNAGNDLKLPTGRLSQVGSFPGGRIEIFESFDTESGIPHTAVRTMSSSKSFVQDEDIEKLIYLLCSQIFGLKWEE